MSFVNGHNLVFRAFPNRINFSVPIRDEQSQVKTLKIYDFQEKDLRKQNHKSNLDF